MNRSIILETFLVWLVVSLLVVCLSIFRLTGFVPLFFVLATLVLSGIYRQSIDAFEHCFRDFFRSVAWFLIASLVVFSILSLLAHFFFTGVQGQRFVPPKNLFALLRRSFELFGIHLATAAFPEELFFRGYLFQRMKKGWNQRWFSIFGVGIGPALFLNALLFALSHCLVFQNFGLWVIVFPSLVFGWLYEKTGFLSASILFHALSNVFAIAWVGMHYV